MHTPTLTIYGSNDPTAKYSVKEERLFKGPHKRVVLPDVGHFPHLEREAEVTGLIMTMASVSAAFSNSIRLTRPSQRATAAAPTIENRSPTATATSAGR